MRMCLYRHRHAAADVDTPEHMPFALELANLVQVQLLHTHIQATAVDCGVLVCCVNIARYHPLRGPCPYGYVTGTVPVSIYRRRSEGCVHIDADEFVNASVYGQGPRMRI